MRCKEDGMENSRGRMEEWLKDLDEVEEVELIFQKYRELNQTKINVSV